MIGRISSHIGPSNKFGNRFRNLSSPVIELFTTVGTTSWTAPNGVSSVSYLVVAGGGGAGNGYDNAGGGGGGAGMVLEGVLSVTPGNSYTVTVGSGGTGGANARSNNSGTNGENSLFGSITSLGGGNGFGSRTGGSYGLSQNSDISSPTGGYGSGGGSGGKGGGGASSNGTINSGSIPGTGGSGISSNITGTLITYGIGGNGGGISGPINGTDGTTNRGNGGNGGSSPSSSSASGGNGGSGIVIIKYVVETTPTPTPTPTETSTPTPTPTLTSTPTPTPTPTPSPTTVVGGYTGSTGTEITFTLNTLFDAYSSRNGITSTDAINTNNGCWQLYYAHEDITIKSGVDTIGLNPHTNGSNSWTWYYAVSNSNDVIGDWGSVSTLAQSKSFSYVAGTLSYSNVTSDVLIPSGRYFLIANNGGPYYRTLKTMANNRTAMVNGQPYVTAINKVALGNWPSGGTTTIPTQFGGSGGSYTFYDGYSHVHSVTFN